MIDLAVVMGVRIKNVHSFFDEKQTIKYQQIHYTVSNMCKNECRWDSLKEGITLFFFSKDKVYEDIEAEILPKIKDILRTNRYLHKLGYDENKFTYGNIFLYS